MLVPRRPQPRPYGSRPKTLDQPLEARTERLRDHLRRTNQLTMPTAVTPFVRQTPQLHRLPDRPPTDVVNAADRGSVSERAVWSLCVVVVEPVWQCLVALVV